MSLLDPDERNLPLRSLPPGKRRGAAKEDRRLARTQHRLQFDAIQHGQREDLRPDLLLAFCRRLVHMCVTTDMLWLALNSAAHDTNASEEEAMRLAKAIDDERKANRVWPEGF